MRLHSLSLILIAYFAVICFGKCSCPLLGSDHLFGDREYLRDFDRYSSPIGNVKGLPTEKMGPLNALPFRSDKQLHYVEYAPNGKLLAAATYEKVYLLDSTSGNLLRVCSDPALNILLISFTADGRQLITLNRDGTVLFFDIESRRIVRRLGLPTSDPEDLIRSAISANRKSLVYEGSITPITICDLDTGKKIGGVHVPNREKPENRTHRMILCPQGKTLALSFDEKDDIFLYAVTSGKTIRTLSSAMSQKLDFSSDGKYVAIYASHDGDRAKEGGYIWDRQKELTRLHFNDVHQLKFSPEGKQLFLWGQDGLRVLDMVTGKMALRKGSKLPHGVFSPDGKILAAIDERDKNRIARWDVDTGKMISHPTD